MRPIDREKQNLLVFGYGLSLIGVIFGIAGWMKHGLSWVQFMLFGISIFLILATAFQWQALRPAYQGWMVAAHAIGTVLTAVILTLVFFLVFTPMSILLRVLGKDYMKRTFERNGESYWIERPSVPFSGERYHQQF